MVPLRKTLYIASLHLIITLYISIKGGLRMLNFKGRTIILNVGNLWHLLVKVPFCR